MNSFFLLPTSLPSYYYYRYFSALRLVLLALFSIQQYRSVGSRLPPTLAMHRAAPRRLGGAWGIDKCAKLPQHWHRDCTDGGNPPTPSSTPSKPEQTLPRCPPLTHRLRLLQALRVAALQCDTMSADDAESGIRFSIMPPYSRATGRQDSRNSDPIRRLKKRQGRSAAFGRALLLPGRTYTLRRGARRRAVLLA